VYVTYRLAVGHGPFGFMRALQRLGTRRRTALWSLSMALLSYIVEEI